MNWSTTVAIFDGMLWSASKGHIRKYDKDKYSKLKTIITNYIKGSIHLKHSVKFWFDVKLALNAT